MDKFSNRMGYGPKEKEITVREDAPIRLREYVPAIMYKLNYAPSFLRSIICTILRVSPDRNNWGEWPNIAGEVESLLYDCDWYYIYDIIEAILEKMDAGDREYFEKEINIMFNLEGIGWKLSKGLIEYRGDSEFEKSVSQITEVLNEAKLPTAQTEIKEAIHDLSRRPKPDITGAIQHAGACLECVSREVTGDRKATLGDIIKKHPEIIPKPLDAAIEKLWGFTSEQGRHLREGNDPEYLEAELVVELTSAIASYLVKKHIKSQV